MTLEELYQRCVDDPSLIPGYIKNYRLLRGKHFHSLNAIEFKDLGIKEEYTADIPSRTKGVVLGLIKQAMIANNPKLKTIDIIIAELNYIKEKGHVRPKTTAPEMEY